MEELSQDTLTWTCQAEDVSEYFTYPSESFPLDLINLILDVETTDDMLSYTFSFIDRGRFLVEREDDYKPPPGATVVPAGEYEEETLYRGRGRANWDASHVDELFIGK